MGQGWAQLSRANRGLRLDLPCPMEHDEDADGDEDWKAGVERNRRRATALYGTGATVEEISDALEILPEDVRVLLGMPPVENEDADGWVLEFGPDGSKLHVTTKGSPTSADDRRD
jgi:hypothetical protein